jgi:AraC-like DNA-binding protein
MRDNLSESVTIDDMARAAMFSKFHFTRIFQRATGVSPGRFLSAIRLQRAKQLLVSTSLNVADISIQVGYNSVGTFSSRFTRSVGLSPTTYRRMGGFSTQIVAGAAAAVPAMNSTVRGNVWPSARNDPGLIFVGLFPGRMPEGRPVSCTILDRPGPYLLDQVPEGTWYLLSHSVPATNLLATAAEPFGDDPRLSVGSLGPILVRRESAVRCPDLRLRPIRTLDPPVLLALLDVRKAALQRRQAAA